MKFHPYSEVFPLIEGVAFNELVADIKANGLREPIWTYEGKILDGRNRFLACQKANVRAALRKYMGNDALGFVISLNVMRRHLSESQRAMAAARIATLREGANQHSSKNIGPEAKPASIEAPSQASAAESLGVGRSSVQRARKVVEKGSKALQHAVESGEVTVFKAASVTDLPKSEQMAAAKAPKPSEKSNEDWSPPDDEDARIAAIEREQEASLQKWMDSDDRYSALVAENKRQSAEIAVLKQSRDGYLNRCGEQVRLIKSLQRKLEKLEPKAA